MPLVFKEDHYSFHQDSILLNINSQAVYPLFIRLAKKCILKGEKVTIIYDGSDPVFFANLCEVGGAFNIMVINFEETIEAFKYPHYNKWVAFLDRQFVRKLKNSLEPFEKYLFFCQFHRRRLLASIDILDKLKPKALIVSEDGVSGNCWLMGAAMQKKIPILDYPYGQGTRLDFDNSLKQKEKDGDLILSEGEWGEYIQEKFPQWVKKGNFKGALMFPPTYILARERYGLSLKDAWIVHGGFANTLAVESEQMYSHYQKEGVENTKLNLIGTLYCDILLDSMYLNKKFEESYNTLKKIESKETSILISWPPSYHAARSHLCEFKTYEELTKEILFYLSKFPGVRLTVSIHPAVSKEVKDFILELGIENSTEYLVELIPQHDIFISCFSSVTRWAIVSRKPVINYDFYQFKLTDYEAAPGVVTLNTFEEFKIVTKKLVEDNHYYEMLAKAQKIVSTQWGILDGKNFERFYSLLTEIS